MSSQLEEALSLDTKVVCYANSLAEIVWYKSCCKICRNAMGKSCKFIFASKLFLPFVSQCCRAILIVPIIYLVFRKMPII